MKGGVDTFLVNLINSWSNEDSLTLWCNASHPGLETIAKKTNRKVEIRKYWRFFASKIAAHQDKFGLGKLFLIKAFMVITYRILQYPILFPWYVLTLALKFRMSKFDRLLVVNGGYPASLLCRAAIVAWHLSRKPVLGIMNFHSGALPIQPKFELFENTIDRWVANSSYCIVTVSHNCLDTILQRKSFIGYKNFKVIYNGIKDPKDTIDTNIQPKIVDISNPYILMLGSYDPRKGHFFLLEAFKLVVAEFPSVNLLIFGYNFENQKKLIQKEILRLGLENKVKLNDFTNSTEILIQNAELIVVPSQKYESFNFTIIEGMAFGIPIVATNVGGMPEVIGDSGAGYVCSKDSPEEFADCILTILRNDLIALEMREKGRKVYIEKYSALTMATSYRKLILDTPTANKVI